MNGALTGGSRKGIPNKASTDVRKAIAKIAESKIGEVESWLDRIAVKNPERALDLYLRLIEYHIPRLARTEVAGHDGGALVVKVVRFGAQEPAVIEGELAEPVQIGPLQ
jgi:hypothetical protein